MRALAVTILVLALLGATAAAFAVTEALKLERSPIGAPRFSRAFSPTCDCRKASARLSLRLRRDETVDASVVDSRGHVVRTLVAGRDYAPGRIRLSWNGRDDRDKVVPDGNYRLRVHLARERRTIVVPNVVRVDTAPPRVRLVDVAPLAFSPDGDGRNDTAAVSFRLSERARVLVFANGELSAARPRQKQGAGKLVWAGKVRGVPLRAGEYALTLRAEDQAGNRSAPTDQVLVLVRYVELARTELRARAGGLLRFRVESDAARIRWVLTRSRSSGRPLRSGSAAPGRVAVRVPRRLAPGRYVLRVSENGHAASASVRVRAGS